MRTSGHRTRYRSYLLPPIVILLLLAVFVPASPALAAPAIEISPLSGAVGTQITISGKNFDSYKGDSISITFNSKEISGSPIVVPDTGSFEITFTIPDGTVPGRHWIEVIGISGTPTVLARNFFMLANSVIELDVLDGPIGTDVTVSGSGFYSALNVTIYYNNVVREKVGAIDATSTGTFDYTFTIPASVAGIHKISAENIQGNYAETNFEVISSIALNLSSGNPGSFLTVNGNGFGQRSQVSIHFGIFAVASVKTDVYGNFSTTFNVPVVNSGVYDIKAQDTLGNLDIRQFTTTAGISLNQSTGPVGFTVVVKGTGFNAGKTISIDFDDLRVTTTTADNNGAFTATFNIPQKDAASSHVITASDDSISRQLAFKIESEAPPAPELLLPSNGTQTKAAAFLDWEDITDDSMPVVYNLQLATDENFSTIILEKEALSESEYRLTEAEWLPATSKPVAYYWRVNAVDSAGNNGEWAARSTFYVSAPAVPELFQIDADSTFEKTVFLNWQDVTSQSPPVKYNLQIASNVNFTTLAIEKSTLPDSEYYISDEEELALLEKGKTYYWRVQAFDSTNNNSEWSSPSSFTMATSFTWPGWATYLLIGIGVIIVVYFAFRFGKRMALQPPD